jgi:hypothetical protein
MLFVYYSDGPNQVTITPSTQSYTLKETENLNQIQCTADCIPVCTMTWSGPNFPADTTSVLNLQNIDRNQAGNYQCTSSNDVSSKTSVVVNVVVQCKYYIYTQWQIQGEALGASAPLSNKSNTYINIRFSRLVNVKIWLLIEWFRSA